jgi:hypothetical protein
MFTVSLNAQDDEWTKYSSTKGRFSITVPCEFSVEEENVPTGDGQTIAQVYHSCAGPVGFYIASYADFTIAGPQNVMLDAFRDGVAKGAQGTIISERSIKLGSYAGREFETAHLVRDQDFRFRWRIYLVGKRMYGTGVGTPLADSKSPDIARYLASFALAGR